MAGLSSRFTKAGYNVPKYMLNVDGNSVFYHSVNGFKKFFKSLKIIFICRDIQDTHTFIHSECKKMGLIDYKIVELLEPTRGQAETVYLGLKQTDIKDDDSMVIFNIDTFRPNFNFPHKMDLQEIDGYLEVFEAEGDHWSFVLPKNDKSNRVVETAEKNRISSLCSSGLYYFKDIAVYNSVFEKILDSDERVQNEFFVAPMYNYLIEKNKDIRYSKIDLSEIIFCGTPEEYRKLIV